MRIHLLCYLFILLSNGWAAQQDPGEQLYLEAKKLSLYQKYDQAAQRFSQLLKEYPSSTYSTESLFWIGFCYHKADEKELAYKTFGKVVSKYPSSPWAEDALDYQIEIASTLLPVKPEYDDFFNQLLKSDEAQIQYKAAAVLLKNGDTSVVPLLQKLQKIVEFEQEITDLLEQSGSNDSQQLQFNIDEDEIRPRKRTPVRKSNSQDERINYFDETRFNQYQAIIRKDDDFTQQELVMFGMWHILPTEKFTSLFEFSLEEQEQWIDQYWHRNDPTPFTEKNEAFNEFLRRVDYAREHYHYFDNIEDYSYAPWDSRGEIYIKLGQPASRKKAKDGEIWYYPEENQLSFFIRPNVTNIFGKAIYIASIDGMNAYRPTTAAAWWDMRNYHNVYIFQPYYKFSLAPYFQLIDKLTLKLVETRPRQITVRYQMPVKSFQLRHQEGLYHLGYVEKYIVFDEDMNIITQHSTPKQITRPTRRDFEKMWRLGQNISLDLTPGKYDFYVQIEDANSEKIGISKLSLTIGAD